MSRQVYIIEGKQFVATEEGSTAKWLNNYLPRHSIVYYYLDHAWHPAIFDFADGVRLNNKEEKLHTHFSSGTFVEQAAKLNSEIPQDRPVIIISLERK